MCWVWSEKSYGKDTMHYEGNKHMLVSDAKNTDSSTPNVKPCDIYQQNSTSNNCLFLETEDFNNYFH
jgi:hypothetical protein